jgi:hypothetical protein
VSLTVRSYFSYLSSSAYLGKQLDEYMKKLPKVRIIRLKERQGLIRARLEGAAVAKGRTQVYLQTFCLKVTYDEEWQSPCREEAVVDRSITGAAPERPGFVSLIKPHHCLVWFSQHHHWA